MEQKVYKSICTEGIDETARMFSKTFSRDEVGGIWEKGKEQSWLWMDVDCEVRKAQEKEEEERWRRRVLGR